MKIKADGYLSRWKYVEVARYVPSLNKIIREQHNKVSILLEWGEAVEEYRHQVGNTGVYHSVWYYDYPDLDSSTRLASLYFDLDSSNINEVQEEALKLVDHLTTVIPESAVRVYFSGQKGFHIECEALALGIAATNELPRLFRYIAGKLRDELALSTIDFAVYDDRRMWRLPNSQHQSTGLFKVELGRARLGGSLKSIRAYAAEPHPTEEPEQVFDAKANEWFRGWSYQIEEQRCPLTLSERIDRFNKLGSRVLHKIEDEERYFNPERLFTNCHALRELWEKAEKTHDLSHEERLFLCSILSYTGEAVQCLKDILSLCNDYNEAITQMHIDDWIRRRERGTGGHPFSCNRANSSGVGCGDCDLDPKEKFAQVGSSLVPTGEYGLPSPVRYAYDKKKGRNG